MSNFEIAITPSIFELERRTKSQDIGNGMAYLLLDSAFGTTSGLKTRPTPKWRLFRKFEIFEIGSF